MKTVLIPIFCLMAVIAQAAAMDTDPAANLSTNIEANRIEILKAINDCRRNVTPTATNMVEVTWNDEAQVTAKKYAELCQMSHSPPEQRKLQSGYECGENLYFSSSPDVWKKAIDAFCNEKKNFVYGSGPNVTGAVTGHYTQVVWYRSHMIACYVVYCPNQPIYKFIYVCHQCPAGNIKGSINTPYEGGPTCAKCPNKCNNGLCTNPCRYNKEFSNCNTFKSMCNDKDNKEYLRKNCPGTCGCTNGEIV